MRIRNWFGAWVCAALMAAAAPLAAQEGGKPKEQDKSKEQDKAKGQQGGEMTAEQMAQMQAWMQAATPNENHQRLNGMIGTWNCVVTTSMPGEEPTTSTGKSIDTWMLGGRYVQTEFAGSFMNMPFEGRGLTGYDNINKRYFSIWIDSMGTTPMIQYGQFDPATNSYTYTGDCMDPMGKKQFMKSVVKVLNHDNYVFTMYSGESPGTLSKMMEITYTRSGPAPSGATSGTASTAAGTTTKLASRTVEAGCGMCVFHMPGVTGCQLAVKVDGKAYLVKGADDVNAHAEGLCSKAKLATTTGQVEGDVFVCTKFELSK